MRLYEVGGAVRDSLLGLPASDRDWVAVGATPEEMLVQGYKPVGRDFPVFLHPQTGEEVALARTERKSAPGYHGFVFHADAAVTLEEDLHRRDLTINAMARDEAGRLIDPWGGERDLRARVLRHVSPAFAEDPVRLLRVARFAARFDDFTVAPETMALLQQIVVAGEVEHLVPERVWQELARGLMEARPSRLLRVLADSGALARLLPELAEPDAARGHRAAVLDAAAETGQPLPVRYALLVGTPATPQGAQAVAERWRVPRDCSELAALLHRLADRLRAAAALDAAGWVQLFTDGDAWRRAARFEQLLAAAQAQGLGELPVARLHQALSAAKAVNVGAAAAAAAAAAKDGAGGDALAAAVAQARADAIRRVL